MREVDTLESIIAEELKLYGKRIEDIKYVIVEDAILSAEEFLEFARFEWGSTHFLPISLKIIGDGWWVDVEGGTNVRYSSLLVYHEIPKVLKVLKTESKITEAMFRS